MVEDWQGVQGFSVRYLVSLTIPSEGVLRIPANTATTAFQDSRFIIDGDLAIDKNGTIGIIGSSVDDSGDYTVTRLGAFSVDWDNVLDKPNNLMLHNRSTGEIACLDGTKIPGISMSWLYATQVTTKDLNFKNNNGSLIGYMVQTANVANKILPAVVKNNAVIGVLDLPIGTTPGLVAPDNQTIVLTGTTIGVKPGSISKSHLDTNLAGKIDKIEVASVEEVKTYFGITE